MRGRKNENSKLFKRDLVAEQENDYSLNVTILHQAPLAIGILYWLLWMPPVSPVS
jgi:hypothetical protein